MHQQLFCNKQPRENTISPTTKEQHHIQLKMNQMTSIHCSCWLKQSKRNKANLLRVATLQRNHPWNALGTPFQTQSFTQARSALLQDWKRSTLRILEVSWLDWMPKWPIAARNVAIWRFSKSFFFTVSICNLQKMACVVPMEANAIDLEMVTLEWPVEASKQAEMTQSHCQWLPLMTHNFSSTLIVGTKQHIKGSLMFQCSPLQSFVQFEKTVFEN